MRFIVCFQMISVACVLINLSLGDEIQSPENEEIYLQQHQRKVPVSKYGYICLWKICSRPLRRDKTQDHVDQMKKDIIQKFLKKMESQIPHSRRNWPFTKYEFL